MTAPQTTITALPGTTHGRAAAGDAAFTVAERVVSQIVQFAVFILAARVLGPADFGIFAMASACAGLLLRVAEAGWAPFIMSLAGDVTVPLQVLFVAIVAGLGFGALGALGVMLASALSWLSAETVALMLTFVLWVVVANAASAQKGVLIWMGRIRAAAICEIAGELVALAVSVAALLHGAGIFALVYGRLSCQTVTLILSFAVTRRAPRRGLPWDVLRDLRVFSIQILSSRILVQARLQLTTLLVGGVLGPVAVGYVRAAERLVGAAAELIAVPGQLMAWTLLRRARDAGDAAGATDRINAQVAGLLKAITILGVPLLIWLMVMNVELVRGLLGPTWMPAAQLVTIFALGRLFILAGILTEPLLSLCGQARHLPAFMATIFVVAAVLTVGAAPFGMIALAWSQVALSVFVLVATIRLFRHRAGIRWQRVAEELAGLVPALAAGVVAILALKASGVGDAWPDLAVALVYGLAGAAVFATGLCATDRTVRAALQSLIRSPQAAKEARP